MKDKVLAAIIKNICKKRAASLLVHAFAFSGYYIKLYLWNSTYMYMHLKSNTTFHPTVSELPYSFEIQKKMKSHRTDRSTHLAHI